MNTLISYMHAIWNEAKLSPHIQATSQRWRFVVFGEYDSVVFPGMEL